MAAKFTAGAKHPGTKTVSQHDPKEPPTHNDARLSTKNTMTGFPGHPKTGASDSRGKAEGGKAGMTVHGPKSLGSNAFTTNGNPKAGKGHENGAKLNRPGRKAEGTMTGKMESLKGRATTSMERTGRKSSLMYSLALLALPVLLFAVFSLTAPTHAQAAAAVGALPALVKVPVLAMTIQNWLIGESPQQRLAEIGIYSTLAPSTTVSQVGASQLQTDFVLLTTIAGAGAVKVLGGSDTTSTPGPCLIGDSMQIINHTGQNVTIYPQSGGTLKNQSANTGFLIATGLTAFLLYLGNGNWALNAS
jgi:hypothetical protein